MKIMAPSYYTSFRCIADRCKNTCCTGWEIFVDDETLEFYKNSKTPFSEKICKNINCTQEGAQFMVDDNMKCPFLLDSGLCEIIKEEGEDWLCQICRDHPRFRNFFSDREEIGLGMCCEEAAHIILSSGDVEMVILEDDGFDMGIDSDDEEFFKKRSRLFEIVQSPLPFSEIVQIIISENPNADICGTPAFWNGFLNNLECMDNKWKEYIDLLPGREDTPLGFCGGDDLPCKNLLAYFLYRHLPKVFEGYALQTCISFCLTSTALICRMFVNSGSDNISDFEETARMFSCEIEYSDENTDAIMSVLEKTI